MPTPQELLDALHAINIGTAWDAGITSEERTTRINAIRHKLITVRQSLKRAQDQIHKRYGSQEDAHVTLAPLLLKPYALLETTINTLESQIEALQHASDFVRPFPDVPTFGQLFIGGEGYGDFILATADDLKTIQKQQHKRAQELSQQHKALEAQKAALKGNVLNRAVVASVRTVTPALRGLISIAGILLFVEIILLIAALRGFSTRPKSADWDATAVVFVAMLATIAVPAIPIVLLVFATQNTSLRPDIQSELKDVETQIAGNEEAALLTKKLYDEAKEGLARIQGQKSIKEKQ